MYSAGDDTSTWTAYVGKVLSAATSYFPAQVSDMMSQDRAFATVHLLKTNQRNICALAMWVLFGPIGEDLSQHLNKLKLNHWTFFKCNIFHIPKVWKNPK